MSKEPIVIKRIRLEALPAFAQTFVVPATSQGVAPITRIRALSQIENPNARPDDVALLAACAGNRVVGYHGVLPGLLADDGRISRVHWSSAVFVAEAFRGRGVGNRLISAFKSLGKDLVVPAGITPGAEGAYRSGDFRSLGKRRYFQLRVERIDRTAPLFQWLSHSAPGGGRPIVSAAAWWGRQAYNLQKKLFYRRAARVMGPSGRESAWQRVDRISRFDLAPAKSGAFFFRGTNAVNWMLANPWVYSRDEITPGELQGDVRHYYFTKTRKLFKYAAFECKPAFTKTCNGFVVLSMSRSRRRAQVKVLDYSVHNGDAARMACGLALTAAKNILADRIEIPTELAPYFRERPRLRRLLKHQAPVCVGYPGKKASPLKKAMGKIALRLIDGDGAFT